MSTVTVTLASSTVTVSAAGVTGATGPTGAAGSTITLDASDAPGLTSEANGSWWVNTSTRELWLALEGAWVTQGVPTFFVPPASGSLQILGGASGPDTVQFIDPELLITGDAGFIAALDTYISGKSIDDLSDVDTSGATGGELLFYRTSPSAGYYSEVLSINQHHFEADWGVGDTIIVPFPWTTGRFYEWTLVFEKSGFHRVDVDYSEDYGASWTSLGFASSTGTELTATPDQVVGEHALLRFTLTQGLALDDVRAFVNCWRSS